MEAASPSVVRMILSPMAYVEENRPPEPSKAPSTKVLQVTWRHPLPTMLGDGEWSVSWDRPDGGSVADEGYGSVAEGSEEPSCGTERSGAPVEIAQPALETVDDIYFEKIFQDRNIVQTPTRILPPLVSTSPSSPSTASQKLSAFFLLAKGTAVPASVAIRFIPTWSSPIAPSPAVTVPVVAVPQDIKPGDLHRSWAKRRLADLNELQELADELAGSGQRGIGTGVLKVGVDGGGHDEDRVRWEAEMVRRERNWVLKQFLGRVVGRPLGGEQDKSVEEDLTEEKEIEQGLEMLGTLAEGLKVNTDDDGISFAATPAAASIPSVSHASKATYHASDEDEEDLFALPLSPRSPDMGISPFSLRGPAIGNMDATILGTTTRSPTQASNVTSKGAIPVNGGAPLAPRLVGSPNPGEMRKKKGASNMPLGING